MSIGNANAQHHNRIAATIALSDIFTDRTEMAKVAYCLHISETGGRNSQIKFLDFVPPICQFRM